jgi:hypothetical protein
MPGKDFPFLFLHGINFRASGARFFGYFLSRGKESSISFPA